MQIDSKSLEKSSHLILEGKNRQKDANEHLDHDENFNSSTENEIKKKIRIKRT